jgi:lysozyme
VILQSTSRRGIELIKEHEGLHLTAYLCPAGVPSIGWGHTRTAKMGQRITLEQAQKLLADDLAMAEGCVHRHVTAPLHQNQFDALVSFVFNVGCGALQRSTLLRHLNANRHDLAAKELTRWNRGGGRVLAGLVRRREAEQNLFREV